MPLAIFSSVGRVHGVARLGVTPSHPPWRCAQPQKVLRAESNGIKTTGGKPKDILIWNSSVKWINIDREFQHVAHNSEIQLSESPGCIVRYWMRNSDEKPHTRKGGPLGARSMAGAGLRRASVGDTTPIVIPLGMMLLVLMLLSVVFKKCKQSNIIAVKLPKSLLHGGGVLRVRRLACTCGVCPACA